MPHKRFAKKCHIKVLAENVTQNFAQKPTQKKRQKPTQSKRQKSHTISVDPTFGASRCWRFAPAPSARKSPRGFSITRKGRPSHYQRKPKTANPSPATKPSASSFEVQPHGGTDGCYGPVALSEGPPPCVTSPRTNCVNRKMSSQNFEWHFVSNCCAKIICAKPPVQLFANFWAKTHIASLCGILCKTPHSSFVQNFVQNPTLQLCAKSLCNCTRIFLVH